MHAILQRAPRELKNDRKTYGVLTQQNPQNQPDDVSHESTVTISDLKEEHGDQVREDEGVGNVGSQDPEEQGAVGVEGDGRPQHTHHHHGHPNDPLHFPVGRLGRSHTRRRGYVRTRRVHEAEGEPRTCLRRMFL